MFFCFTSNIRNFIVIGSVVKIMFTYLEQNRDTAADFFFQYFITIFNWLICRLQVLHVKARVFSWKILLISGHFSVSRVGF